MDFLSQSANSWFLVHNILFLFLFILWWKYRISIRMQCNRYHLPFVKLSFQGLENSSFQVLVRFTARGYVHAVIFCSTEQRKSSLCQLLQPNPIKRLREKSWRDRPCSRSHTTLFYPAFPPWSGRQLGAASEKIPVALGSCHNPPEGEIIFKTHFLNSLIYRNSKKNTSPLSSSLRVTIQTGRLAYFCSLTSLFPAAEH